MAVPIYFVIIITFVLLTRLTNCLIKLCIAINNGHLLTVQTVLLNII